jgi:broad specificity phosphatase PhoE
MSRAHLYLVRHGESAWNAESRLQGQADPALSERGREQAISLAATVATLDAEQAVVSDLTRAAETAQLAGHPDAAVDPRWRERGLGVWETQLERDVSSQDMTAFRDNRFVPEGGEAWPAFQARVGSALDDLANRGGSWLVFTHGGCVRAAIAHLTGADALTIAGPSNASLTVLEVAPRRRLRAFNRTGSAALERPSEPGA